MLSFFYLSTFSLELAGFSRPGPKSGHKFKLLAAELSLQNFIAIFCTNKNSWVKKEIQRKIHCFISAQVPQPSSENADCQGYQT